MNNLLLILQLFPFLLEAIKAIEAAAPVPDIGAAKFQLLKTTVQSGVTAGGLATAKISEDQFLLWLQAITATIVTFYNILGIFKTTVPAAPPVQTTPAT
jgi:hypothetical protein